jgi:WD40 repeat protein
MFFFGPDSERPAPEPQEETVPSAPSPNDLGLAPSKQFRDLTVNGVPERNLAASPAQPAPKRGRKAAASAERNGSATRKPSASANRATNAATMDVDMVNGHVPPLTDARSPSATEPGPDDTAHHVNGIRPDERMDIDEDVPGADQQHQEQLVESIPPIVHTLTTGESVGIQVAPAKVTDLAHSAKILNLPALANRENSPAVTRICWQPGDRKVVAMIGEDFSGLWQLTDGATAAANPQFRELVNSKLTSAISWQPQGETLAVATYSDQSGDITLFDGEEFALTEQLTASQRAITCFLWHQSSHHLFGIAPYNSEETNGGSHGGSSIVRWNLADLPDTPETATITVPEILMDMCGAFQSGVGVICAVGQHAIYCCRTSPDFEIEQRWASASGGIDQWTIVRCDWRAGTGLFLVAASAENGTIWLPAQNVFKRSAHDGPITGLELRPRPASFSSSSKLEFATSSMDGTIKIWRLDEESRSIFSVCKVIIGHGSPIMALAYSPDGFCLAGASYDTVKIWNAEHGHNHMATWKDEQNSWSGARLRDDDMMSLGGRSSINGDTPPTTADHALAWASDSRTLGFGLGSQVSSVTQFNCVLLINNNRWPLSTFSGNTDRRTRRRQPMNCL